MGIEVWAPGWQAHRFDPHALEDRVEARAKLRIAMVQQIPTPAQETEIREGRVAGYLLHPLAIG